MYVSTIEFCQRLAVSKYFKKKGSYAGFSHLSIISGAPQNNQYLLRHLGFLQKVLNVLTFQTLSLLPGAQLRLYVNYYTENSTKLLEGAFFLNQ